MSLRGRFPAGSASDISREWTSSFAGSLHSSDLAYSFVTLVSVFRLCHHYGKLDITFFVWYGAVETAIFISLMFLLSYRKKTYTERRPLIISFCRIFRLYLLHFFMRHASVGGKMFPPVGPLETEGMPREIRARFIMPLMVGINQAFGFRATLSHHVLLQGLSATFFWIGNLNRCSLECSSNAAVYGRFYASIMAWIAPLQRFSVTAVQTQSPLSAVSCADGCFMDCASSYGFCVLAIYVCSILVLAALEEPWRYEFSMNYGGTPFFLGRRALLASSLALLPLVAAITLDFVSSVNSVALALGWFAV